MSWLALSRFRSGSEGNLEVVMGGALRRYEVSLDTSHTIVEKVYSLQETLKGYERKRNCSTHAWFIAQVSELMFGSAVWPDDDKVADRLEGYCPKELQPLAVAKRSKIPMSKPGTVTSSKRGRTPKAEEDSAPDDAPKSKRLKGSSHGGSALLPWANTTGNGGYLRA